MNFRRQMEISRTVHVQSSDLCTAMMLICQLNMRPEVQFRIKRRRKIATIDR